MTDNLADEIKQQQERANQARLDAIARRAKIEKRSPQPQYYLGHDDGKSILGANDGSMQRVTNVGNVQAPLGSISRLGAGAFDPGISRRPQDRRRPRPTGEIVILASVVESGERKFYIGGDRKTPLLIASIPETGYSAYLEITGKGRDNWIVHIQHGETIQRISGTTEGDYNLSDPRVPHLRYRGNDFWNSSYFYKHGGFVFAEQDVLPTPTIGSALSQLGVTQCLGEHTEIGGLTTIAVAYCEDHQIVGPTSVTLPGYDRRSGVVQTPDLPVTFSGTNTYAVETSEWAALEGTASGPGYLGPGGEPCTPGTPSASGSATFPNRTSGRSNNTTRSLSTQCYAFVLSNGQITTEQGGHSLSGGAGLQIQDSSGGGYSRIDYGTACLEYLSPNGFRHSIFVTATQTYPSTPLTETPSDSGVSETISLTKTIAPGFSKSIGWSVSSPNQAGPATGTETGAESLLLLKIGDGVLFSELEAQGTCSLSLGGKLNAVSPIQKNQTTLRYKGAEIKSTSMPFTTTWQDDGTQYPRGSRVVQSTLNDIFDKDVKGDVAFLEGQITGDTLNFSELNDPVMKKALKMPIGDGAIIEAARFWGLR